MTRDEVLRVVLMSDAEFDSHLAALRAAEEAAYAKYHGVFPAWPAKPGSPQMAGYGTQIGRFRGQEAWHEARDRRDRAERVRRDKAAWGLEIRDGIAHYTVACTIAPHSRGRAIGHAIEIKTHGVDVSDCPTPTAAIAKVRAAFAA